MNNNLKNILIILIIIASYLTINILFIMIDNIKNKIYNKARCNIYKFYLYLYYKIKFSYPYNIDIYKGQLILMNDNINIKDHINQNNKIFFPMYKFIHFSNNNILYIFLDQKDISNINCENDIDLNDIVMKIYFINNDLRIDTCGIDEQIINKDIEKFHIYRTRIILFNKFLKYLYKNKFYVSIFNLNKYNIM